VRVIAGRLGGRRLVAPRGLATRPTTDRVREALFSALGSVTGARVLDLYAGTGALGIEALSRGASRAVFVESARPAIAALRENLGALDLLSSTRVVAQPAARAIAAIVASAVGGAEGPFDLVFADPPYAALADVPPLAESLVASGALASGARFVLEHASRDAAPDLGALTPRPTRTYGDTAVTIYDVPDA
jgi:16S rRNA (guanine966-N2)-methyltransferase